MVLFLPRDFFVILNYYLITSNFNMGNLSTDHDQFSVKLYKPRLNLTSKLKGIISRVESENGLSASLLIYT